MTRDEFFERVAGMESNLFAFALSRLKNRDDALDAVHDAYLKAEKSFERLRDESKLESWMIRILANICFDFYRSAKRKNEEVIPEDSERKSWADSRVNLARRVEENAQVERVLDAMLEIPNEEYRDVAILFYYRQLSLKEIADLLDVPEGTVKSRLARSRKQLAAKFREKEISEQDLRTMNSLQNWPY